MKTIYKKLLFLFLLLPLSIIAQNSLNGLVVDKKSNQPLPGVNVTIKGNNKGTTTDFDGKFQLAGLKNGDIVVFSFIGYTNETLKFTGQKTVTITLDESANQLQEVVVQVGYGSVKKKDATGSVAVLSAKDFNKGAILSADQLLVGKVAGVRITNGGGDPDSSPNIRIRGGASLSAQQSPLVIIDNVPIDNNLAAGQGNIFSLINPNDIESFTILKDASATAIYGSRASNGVIIITTKKGSAGAPQFSYTSTYSFGSVNKKINVFDGVSYASFINTNYPTYADKLGILDPNDPTKRILYNTDWQNEIYRKTISQDHNFSARAAIFGNVPFRASIGYNNTQGVVKTNDYSRISAGFKVTPTFFDGHLKIDINAKGLSSKKNAIDAGSVISAALNMDPTKPVYGDSPNNRFVGYYQETFLDATSGRYNIQGQLNPIARLNQRYRPESVDKFLGNIELDYKMHFLPDLRAVVNLGIETSQSNIEERFSNSALETYQFNQSTDPTTNYLFNPGLNFKENQTISNKTFDAYLVYSKKLKGFVSKVEAQGGHNFQSFVLDGNKSNFLYNPTTGVRQLNIDLNNLNNRYYGKMTLESYFGRLNVDLLDKYLFTATIRGDASSLFPKDRRWGYFPAGAFAWKVKEESFLKNSSFVKDLKLRIGYGLTGNSDIRNIPLAGYYPYTPNVVQGSPQGQYLPGVNIYSVLPYKSLTWEKTATSNVGLDFDIFKSGFVSGTVDVYQKKTKDLLAFVQFPPGQFLTNDFVNNSAAITQRGMEFSLNVKLISSDNINWSLNGNIAYYKGIVDNVVGTSKIAVGNLPGIGRTLTYHAVGEQPGSAWVFEQVYDIKGNPIPDAYVDRNSDGVIDDKDKYYAPLTPNWTFGFSTTFNYKKFDFNASFRGQLGGKIYNSVKYQYGWASRAIPNVTKNLNNVLNTDFLFDTVNGNIATSDYFLENATFLRCESMSLGYKFDKLYKSTAIRLYVGANNLFILTKYSGQDPENFGGIDTNFYPRPRVFNMGVNIDF